MKDALKFVSLLLVGSDSDPAFCCRIHIVTGVCVAQQTQIPCFHEWLSVGVTFPPLMSFLCVRRDFFFPAYILHQRSKGQHLADIDIRLNKLHYAEPELRCLE